ncbi:MAG: type I-C CRISPR-associated protein Cas8c/Csd1 [Acetobacteraceae bacterium]
MTVLQALDRYYDRMAARGEAEAPGYSREKIGFAIVLSPTGEPVQILDLREASGKRMVPRLLEVPAAVKRTAGILPNLFWDKTSYVLGRTAGEGRRTAEEHAAFKAANLAMLDGANDEGIVALRRFLESWSPARFDMPPFAPEMLDTNIIFRLDGELGYIHQRGAARRLIETRVGGDGPLGFCLITGLEAPLRRLHPSVKGVEGAQSSGASLVSFNLDAFSSYGKEQGANAPTSEVAAFRYGAALNRMLDRGSRNRVARPIGDASVVFWADISAMIDETAAQAAEGAFAGWFDQPAQKGQGADDASEAAKLRDALGKLAEGRPVQNLDLGLVPGTRFHVLGLAPNAARLSVRYWLADDFEVFARRLAGHYRDLAIEPAPWGANLPSIQRLLVKTTALQEKFDNIPPLLAGEVTRAVLSGTRYPRTLLTASIIRLRAGDDPGSGWHAAAIKACINRSEEENAPMALEPDNPSAAYQLGRLFAVLESAQYAALGRVNAPISARYYGSASATPARVFGPLLRGLRHHVADALKQGRGGWIDGKIGEIMAKLQPELPRTLRLEDQGRFAIGYYHERASRRSRTDETDPSEEGASR